MPAIAPVALLNESGTPLTYTPGPEVSGVQSFRKADPDGVPIGEKTLSVSLRETPENRKVRLKLVIPIVQTETINGVDSPKVIRRNWVDVEFTFNKHSTDNERAALRSQIQSALGSTSEQPLLGAVIEDLEGMY